MRLRAPLVLWLGTVRLRGRGGGATSPGDTPTSPGGTPTSPGGGPASSRRVPAGVEPLEGRRLLAAAAAPDPFDRPSDLRLGEPLAGSVASLTGVNAAPPVSRPGRAAKPPKAVIRWGDGRRTQVNAIVADAGRLVAFVPPGKSHAYRKPGAYDVVVVFRQGSRVLGRVTEVYRVSDTPHGVPVQPAAGRKDPERFENQVRKYESKDRKQPPPTGGVLFVGSSSIERWTTLAEDFPGVPVIGRGFGGAEIPDWSYYAHRMVLPYRPATVVFYCGENDLASEFPPQQVLEDFKTFAGAVHSALPNTRILFMSVKPSPALWKIADAVRETNRLVEEYTLSDPARLGFIDVYTPMLGPDGQPRTELFVADGQHLSRPGYALWTQVVKGWL